MEMTVIDFTHKVEETIDSIEQQIGVIRSIVANQTVLVNLVKKSKQAKDFETFCKGIEDDNANKLRQVETLKFRANTLKDLLTVLKAEDKLVHDTAITTLMLLCFGLGIEKPENYVNNDKDKESVPASDEKIDKKNIN